MGFTAPSVASGAQASANANAGGRVSAGSAKAPAATAALLASGQPRRAKGNFFSNTAFLPRRNPLLGTFTHAPTSGKSSVYFSHDITSGRDHRRQVALRHNPYTGASMVGRVRSRSREFHVTPTRGSGGGSGRRARDTTKGSADRRRHAGLQRIAQSFRGAAGRGSGTQPRLLLGDPTVLAGADSPATSVGSDDSGSGRNPPPPSGMQRQHSKILLRGAAAPNKRMRLTERAARRAARRAAAALAKANAAAEGATPSADAGGAGAGAGAGGGASGGAGAGTAIAGTAVAVAATEAHVDAAAAAAAVAAGSSSMARTAAAIKLLKADALRGARHVDDDSAGGAPVLEAWASPRRLGRRLGARLIGPVGRARAASGSSVGALPASPAGGSGGRSPASSPVPSPRSEFQPIGVAPAHMHIEDWYTVHDHDCVGEGAFGKICLATKRDTAARSDDESGASGCAPGGGAAGSGTRASGTGGTHGREQPSYVVKIIRKAYLFSAEERESVCREAHIHATLRHPNIVALHDAFESKTHVYLVMERVKGQTLHAYMRDKPSFSEAESAVLAKQLLMAVEYLHSHGVIHCDIKPQNILLQAEAPGQGQTLGKYQTVKLCDFGTARRSRDARYFTQTGSVSLVPFSTVTGTMGFVAPEVLRKRPYDAAIDMWSIGVLLYEMLVGFSPFYPYTTCIDEAVEFPRRYWASISPGACDVVRGLLQRDPAKRISAKSALAHPWLEQAALEGASGRPSGGRRQRGKV